MNVSDPIGEFVGNGPDAPFLRAILTPVSLNYESDLVKFVEESGVIPDGIIELNNGGITVYNEDGTLSSSGIASASSIDFHYKYQYLRYRDKNTIGKLKDKDKIPFADDAKSSDKSDDESKGIRYQSFIENNYKLNDPDKIIFPCSYIDIHFNSPCWKDHVTFRINAEDEMLGFRRLELMKRALERYHLLYYLFKNYNIEEGKINPENPSYLFSPVLYSNEYTDNGLKSLIYNKELNYWVFECIEYP